MKLFEKINTLLGKLNEQRAMTLFTVSNVKIKECDYKTNNVPPKDDYTDMTIFDKRDTHYWLHFEFETPEAEEGFNYYLKATTGINGWDASNPQAIVYLNGKMVQGFDVNHTDVLLEPSTKYDAYIYLYTGTLTDYFKLNIFVDKLHNKTTKLYYDILTAFEALRVLNENTSEYVTILKALEMTVNLIDFRAIYSEDYYNSIDKAEEYIENEFYNKICSTKDKPTVHLIGHTHIDVEWRWHRRQTREKIQRSFATAKALMDEYPEYLFTLSQPELYRYLKEEAPEKYDELKALVECGRWEPEGAMYVEADCNLVSGESFVRQILKGKQFFKKEFGVDSKILFLPDVFGYSAALPQILKKSGIDYFVTSKISWNDTNRMPYDSFMWQGIDGTEIFSTFITAQGAHKDHATENRTTYVGTISAPFVLGAWDRYQQKEYNTNVLLTFGYGDGGGGPTREMLEKGRRLEKGIPGIPRTKMNFLLPFLQDAKSEFDENAQKLKRTPRWVGELYLEFHRGTYTSIAKNKRNNRKGEFSLQNAEALSYIDFLLGGTYDRSGLDLHWRKLLHNQFHDILPGSSIFEVYEGTDKDYSKLFEFTDSVTREKLDSIKNSINTEGGYLVYNPLGFDRTGTVQIHGKTVETDVIPALGWRVIDPVASPSSVIVDGLNAENRYYSITLDASGRIASLFDKENEREICLNGKLLNEFQAFEDYPYQYDAWEMSDYYKSKMYVLDDVADITPVFDGMRAGFLIKKKYMNSYIEESLWLYTESRRIDFEAKIDWHEKHQILKIVFPIDVNTDKATYEIQYGNVSRPTHSNTSWDAAKYEVCAHKWLDISESGYGVSILNDCKYGFSAEGTTVTLTALKCATDPNPYADEGLHVFSYALLPHSCSFRDINVVKEAYSFNQPLIADKIERSSGKLNDTFSLISVDKDNVIIDTLKMAEDSEDMIVRMYEAYNSRCNFTLTSDLNIEKAFLSDLMENELQELSIVDNKITLPIKNFEIITLKLKLKK
jgi:alpha-mannosidase